MFATFSARLVARLSLLAQSWARPDRGTEKFEDSSCGGCRSSSCC